MLTSHKNGDANDVRCPTIGFCLPVVYFPESVNLHVFL